jgi:outer membrane receptor protein involved in Fe transport
MGSDREVLEQPYQFYTDLTLNYDLDVALKGFGVYFTINNVFDRSPPSAPAPYFVLGTSGGGTSAALFDVIGRTYTLGFKVSL